MYKSSQNKIKKKGRQRKYQRAVKKKKRKICQERILKCL